jgi:hypothetical protein
MSLMNRPRGWYDMDYQQQREWMATERRHQDERDQADRERRDAEEAAERAESRRRREVAAAREDYYSVTSDLDTVTDQLREANRVKAQLLVCLKEAVETCAFMDLATEDERLTDGDCLNRWKAAIAEAEARS